jgi:NAD(P)-dependent dehydrogenase (short-subunit alcohol dehydrogenase family)
VGRDVKQQSERCLPFYKGCSSSHDRKKLRSYSKCKFWCRKAGFSNLSSYCASKFGLAGLAESLQLEVAAYKVRIMTIFLGRVATKMWQDYDYDYYERNKNKMLSPQKVAAKIVEMIFDANTYKNGDSYEMYNT